ncbi:hypothetical protein BRC83_09150 [Halobacteriales archaeon QS_1_68_17]|nr:MAG: hypothetical protein BRC83_09150 [Halobacteriales archaeon QS_1_68_17]
MNAFDLVGVAEVVVAVSDLDAAAERMCAYFGAGAPVRRTDEAFGADLAALPDAPVTLAAPRPGTDLAARVERFGDLPCAFLLDTDDLPATRERFDLPAPSSWGKRRVCWFETPLPGRLGVRDRA